MPKVIHFTTAAARLAQTPTATTPPRISPAQVWIDSRKPGRSRVTARHQADVAARLLGYADVDACPWHTLGYLDGVELRAILLGLVDDDVYTPATANNVLGAFKSIMGEAWRIGVGRADKYLDAEALEVIRQIERVPGRHLRRDRRTLDGDEIVRLLAHCEADRTARGARDAALVAVAIACGLRASEYAALDVTDYDRDGARLRIPQIKTDTSEMEVWLPFEPPATVYVDKWLAWRGPRPGVLFTRLERGGVGVIQAMTPEAVSHILWRRGEACGIGRVSCHALRRAFVCRILDATGDLSAAAKLARHVNVRTTATYYDTRPLESLRETMRRVPWPGASAS